MRGFSIRKPVLVLAICCIGLTFILYQIPALAQASIGKLSAFQGEVKLIRKGKPQPLKLNMQLVAKDRVMVGVGEAQITYDDGSILTIKSRTDITLDQREKKRKIFGIWSKPYLSRIVTIFKGKVSGIMKKRRSLVTEFETPTLIAGVRGTDFTIEVYPETGETKCSVGAGMMELFSKDGWTVFELTEGQVVGVYSDPETGSTSVYSYKGEVTITSGDATIRVEPGDAMTAVVDPNNGAASVTAAAGTIEVTVGNASAEVEEGESIYADEDPDTGVVTVVATAGEVPVTAEGVTQILTPETPQTTVTPGEPPTPPAQPAEPSVAPEAPPPPPPPPLPVSPFR
jgi:quercetin dioxygenase-like cupin family protein